MKNYSVRCNVKNFKGCSEEELFNSLEEAQEHFNNCCEEENKEFYTSVELLEIDWIRRSEKEVNSFSFDD